MTLHPMIRNSILVTSLIMLVMACSAIPAPKSFDQSLAYAYGTHTAIMTSAANALDTKLITVEDAEEVLKISDQARVVLDMAKATYVAGDVTTAEGQLQMAIGILTNLQIYLNSRIQK